MPIMGKCPYCRKSAGLFRVQHDRCEAAHRDGQRQMVTLVVETVAEAAVAAAALSAKAAAIAAKAAERARRRGESESVSEDAWLNLSNELSNIAANSYIDVGDIPSLVGDIPSLVAEGWNRAVRKVIENNRLSFPEKDDQLVKLEGFLRMLSSRGLQGLLTKSSFSLDELSPNKFYRDAQERLNKYASSRLADTAKEIVLLPGLSRDGLSILLQTPPLFRGLDAGSRQDLLAKVWSDAVLAFPKDRTLSLEQEQSLRTYLLHFGLTRQSVNQKGAYDVMVQFNVLREVAEGEIPDRSGVIRSVPFNMVKSERLIWVTRNVAYCEPVTRKEWRGTATELGSLDVTFFSDGPSFSQSTTTSHSRLIEWEETVEVDRGLLGVTSEHLYFHGSRHRFRIPYGRIVALEHRRMVVKAGVGRGDRSVDGIALTQDNQDAKLQSFHTSDAWFIHRLASTLDQR